jgi:signal transduction histidine kinase/putative methionine-R-sulfoxide reductase with GAF domain
MLEKKKIKIGEIFTTSSNMFPNDQEEGMLLERLLHTKNILRPLSLVLGFLYSILAVSYLLSYSPEMAVLLAIEAEATAIGLLIIYFLLGRKAITETWAHPLAAVISGLVLANSLLHIYLTHELQHTIFIILLIIAAGIILNSHHWLFLITVVSLSSWLLVISTMTPSPMWLHYIYALGASTMLGVVIHSVKINTLKRLETLREQDARRKAEIEEVLETTEDAKRSLATSMAIGQRISSILDLDVLLNQVADLIKERFTAHFVGIFLLDETGEYLVARAGTGDTGRALVFDGFRFKKGQEGIIGWVAEKRRAVCFDDVTLDNRHIPLELLPNVKSELALPLETGRQLLGVLDIQSDKKGMFKEDDVPFLQMLADQVAIAIQNATLFQMEQSRRRFAETLYGVGKVFSNTVDQAEVLELILIHLKEILSHDRASIFLIEGDWVKIAAANGYRKSYLKFSSQLNQYPLLEEIYTTQKPLYISDVTMRENWKDWDNSKSTRSWLGLPLIRSHEVMGILSIVRESYNPFNQEEITLSATFASQSAVALQNARLYEQINQLNQDLENIVKQRTEALQAAYNQLERLDRTKSDFISVASHELRTPITVLSGYCQMLLEDTEIHKNNLHKQIVQGIYTGTTRLNEIVSSLLDIAKIDSRALQLHTSPVLIGNLIDHVCSSLLSSMEERNQTLVVEDLRGLPAIQADLEALRKVFYHLIVNAIKYTPDQGTITISGRLLGGEEDASGEGAVEIIVSDTGIGIDQEAQNLIFNKFYQTGEVASHSSGKVKFKGGGPGLGLAIAQGIIKAHGGRIWVESSGYDEDKYPGSRFHVVLPLHQ